jgi:hypothetical protein
MSIGVSMGNYLHSSPGGKAGVKRRRTGEEDKKMSEEELAERRVDEKYFEVRARAPLDVSSTHLTRTRTR